MDPMQRRIDYLKSVAKWSLPINLILAVLIGLVSVWAGVIVAINAVYLSFATYVGAHSAENIRKLDAKLERLGNDVGELRRAWRLEERVAELEAENHELRAIAEAALDQRDAAT